MTEARIYGLAYNQALMVWDNWNTELKKFPDNPIFQHRVKKAWEEMEELRAIIVRKGLLHEI